ncbi:MAG: spondin domain-containing protein [Iphinoe sp. HA4291-MV1]|jgi:hypothetical protein|nr:spondin domain-containing protein [Iphinoe sp. HA4291-MV1]
MQLRTIAIGFFLGLAALTAVHATEVSSQRTQKLTPSNISQASNSRPTRFKVRIENISTTDEFIASDGTKWTLDFSPGVWLVHNNNNPIFTTGQKDRGQGLEAIAEDGNPTMLAKSLQNQQGILSSKVFNIAVGATKPKGIRPGQAFEFTVTAKPGQKLSFVTMFGQSNDWFYAPDGAGITLFDADGKPMSSDITSQIILCNGGTEVDQEPGIGSEQGPRQKAPNTGAAENGVVQVVNDQSSYTQTNQVMRVTITPMN